MRLRAVLLLAFAVLLLHPAGTRFAADPPPPSDISAIGWITPISLEDSNCPIATHDLRECRSLAPGYYMVIEKTRGWAKISGWGTVRGTLDLDACAPYKLIHVRRLMKKTEVLPPPCN
jgi:hypothetical protein